MLILRVKDNPFLRKLESAGIIKAYNMDPQGVRISVPNPYLYDYAKEAEAAGAQAVQEQPPITLDFAE